MESEKPGGKGVNWSPLLESLAPSTQFPVKPNSGAECCVVGEAERERRS